MSQLFYNVTTIPQYHNCFTMLQLFRNVITVPLELIQKEFHNLKFSRSHSYKRERKKIIRNVLRENPYYLKSILPYQYDPKSCFEAVSTKNKKKRMLKTFLEKSYPFIHYLKA